MPISDLGYRHWQGERVSALWRWRAITRNEFGIAYRSSRLLRRFLVVAWMPLIWFAPAFFVVGWIADPGNEMGRSLVWRAMRSFLTPETVEVLRSDPEALLPLAWSMLFYFFLAIPQAYLTMLILAIVAPPLVAKDFKHRAFLFYFSKPIGPWQYVLGKVAVAVAFISLITLLPALVLYVISIALAPTLATAIATAPILLRILAASLLISVPLSMVALWLSSLTSNARIAAFAWIVIWIVGEATFVVFELNLTMLSRQAGPPWAFLCSLRETTTMAAAAVFDIENQAAIVVQRLRDAGVDVEFVFRSLRHQDANGPMARAFRQALGFGSGNDSAPLLAIAALLATTVLCAFGVVRQVRKPVQI